MTVCVSAGPHWHHLQNRLISEKSLPAVMTVRALDCERVNPSSWPCWLRVDGGSRPARMRPCVCYIDLWEWVVAASGVWDLSRMSLLHVVHASACLTWLTNHFLLSAVILQESVSLTHHWLIDYGLSSLLVRYTEGVWIPFCFFFLFLGKLSHVFLCS